MSCFFKLVTVLFYLFASYSMELDARSKYPTLDFFPDKIVRSKAGPAYENYKAYLISLDQPSLFTTCVEGQEIYRILYAGAFSQTLVVEFDYRAKIIKSVRRPRPLGDGKTSDDISKKQLNLDSKQSNAMQKMFRAVDLLNRNIFLMPVSTDGAEVLFEVCQNGKYGSVGRFVVGLADAEPKLLSLAEQAIHAAGLNIEIRPIELKAVVK